jgi:nicotinamidase-related amidase
MKRLLIIDPQVSFCEPGASLLVDGAQLDMIRLAYLVREHSNFFSSIDISLDCHQRDDIAHPMFWKDINGKNPAFFTQITVSQVENGEWLPVNNSDLSETIKYLKFLERSCAFKHTIWPEHCIAGTDDVKIVSILRDALFQWSNKTGISFHTHIKGMNRMSEHYGIFQAEAEDAPFNHRLIHSLFSENSEVFVAGEAKSHCVATSLKQILEHYPQHVPQITLISDATSNVGGFEHVADSIYDALEKAGMKTITTEELEKEEVHA